MIFMTKFMVSGEDFPLNQSILVGGLEHFLFSILYGIILPIKVLARAPPATKLVRVGCLAINLSGYSVPLYPRVILTLSAHCHWIGCALHHLGPALDHRLCLFLLLSLDIGVPAPQKAWVFARALHCFGCITFVGFCKCAITLGFFAWTLDLNFGLCRCASTPGISQG